MRIAHCFCLALTFFVLACEQKPGQYGEKPTKANQLAEVSLPQVSLPSTANALPAVEKKDSIEPTPPKVEIKYDHAPFYFLLNGEQWLYIGENKSPQSHKKKLQKDSRLGILNPNKDLVLPMEFNKIFNPDATAKGYIELQRNGKYGLFGYLTGTLFKAKYDAIYRSDKPGTVAIGQIGSLFYFLLPNGNNQVISEFDEIPQYTDLGHYWGFDNEEKDFLKLFHNPIPTDSQVVQSSFSIRFLPSYLLNLNFFPEFLAVGESELNTNTENYGEVRAAMKNVSGGISALISSYFFMEIDPMNKQYSSENLYLSTVDKHNIIYSTLRVNREGNTPFSSFCMDEMASYKYLKNGLVEIKVRGGRDSGGTGYTGMPAYKYFKIGSDGSIAELHTDRVFDFTQFAALDESYFGGCYCRPVSPKGKVFGKAKDGNLLLSEHLRICDLELMENELLASYGMRFKTEKWRQYFESKDWYQAQYDEVESFLSDLELSNLKFIQGMKQKMKGRERRFTKAYRTWFSIPKQAPSF